MNFRTWFDGVELDLLDFLLGAFRVCGALFREFGGAGTDAGVGVVDVVVEDFVGVVAWGCYAGERYDEYSGHGCKWRLDDLPVEEKTDTIST